MIREYIHFLVWVHHLKYYLVRNLLNRFMSEGSPALEKTIRWSPLEAMKVSFPHKRRWPKRLYKPPICGGSKKGRVLSKAIIYLYILCNDLNIVYEINT